MSLSTPVGFLIFNRPDVTQRVFCEIARARPKTLLVVCDGPRVNCAGERERVEAARAIIDQVDWPCDVKTNYLDENLGCKYRIGSGLNWIFSHCEEAIILEDDCLPEPSFFPFCEELLDRYRDDRRVVSISGNNFQNGQTRTQDSYYFSKYFHCWGWASWRRVWEDFDLEMASWPTYQAMSGLHSFADSESEEQYWQRIFSMQHQGEISSWAYPWLYSCAVQSGLTAIPEVNLVSNIGFGDNATHTTADSHLAAIATNSIEEQLRHPSLVVRNKIADQYTFRHCYQRPPRLLRLQRKIQRHVMAWCHRPAA